MKENVNENKNINMNENFNFNVNEIVNENETRSSSDAVIELFSFRICNTCFTDSIMKNVTAHDTPALENTSGVTFNPVPVAHPSKPDECIPGFRGNTS